MFDFVYDIINEAVDEGRFVDIEGVIEELTGIICYATKN